MTCTSKIPSGLLLCSLLFGCLSNVAFGNYAQKADESFSCIDTASRPVTGSEGPSRSIQYYAALLSSVSAAAMYNPEKYKVRIARISEEITALEMEKEWSNRESLTVLLASLDAWSATGDAKYLLQAQSTFTLLESHWSDGDGICDRNGDLVFRDPMATAYFYTAAARLANMPGKKASYGQWAKRARDWVNFNARLQSEVYSDSPKTGRAGCSGLLLSAAMVEANLAEYEATKSRLNLTEAKRIADAVECQYTSAGTGIFVGSTSDSCSACKAFANLSNVTGDKRYRLIAQKNVQFAYKYVRDPADGGYRREWSVRRNHGEEEKDGYSNVVVAGTFAELFRSPDLEELYDAGIRAATAKEYRIAADRFSEVTAIDDTSIEAWYRLYRCQTKLRHGTEAAASIKRVKELYSAGGRLRERLKAIAAPEVVRAVEKQP